MRRLALVLLLPVVWVPLGAFLLLALPALPWWAWLASVGLWVVLWRRRRASGVDLGPADPNAAGHVSLGGF